MPQENENSFFIRALKCSMFNSESYEEVEHDESAIKQALILVLISGMAYGLFYTQYFFEAYNSATVLSCTVAGIIKWALLAWVAYFIGTKIFRTEETEADWGQLARTLGFATTPGLIFFSTLFLSPTNMEKIYLIWFVWVLITSFIAIRQALELTNLRAIGTAVISVACTEIIINMIGALLG